MGFTKVYRNRLARPELLRHGLARTLLTRPPCPERDVFHTGNPDTTLWEFKHGNGSFKRGDIAGLREIKRRASKQLVPKEAAYVKASPSQPGTPAEPVQLPPETTDGRLAHLEHSIYEINSRLHKSEEQTHSLHVRNQAAMDTISRLLQFNQDMSRMLQSLLPVDSPLHRDGMYCVCRQLRPWRWLTRCCSFGRASRGPAPSRGDAHL